MADGVTVPGTGEVLAFDDVAGSPPGGKVQRVKPVHGVDGSATDTSGTNPMPVTTAALDSAVDDIGVEGMEAHDAPYTRKPIPLGAYAKAAAPSNVSADADIVRLWALLNGALAVNLTAAGALIPGDATNGLDIDVTRMAALIAGTALVGNVGSKQTRISVSPTVAGAAYVAKDAVGGIMTFANAVGVSGGTGILQSVTIVDKGQIMLALDLVLFDQTIAGTVTDSSAFDPTDGDLANVIAVIPISSWSDFNDNSVAHRGGLGIPIKAAATSIFGALVARSAGTLVASTDIIVTLGILQDA